MNETLPTPEEEPTLEPTPEPEPSPSPEPEEQQPPATASKAQKRIQHLSARANEAQRRAEEAERQLAEARALLAQKEGSERPQGLSEAEIDRLVEQRIAEREQGQRRGSLVNAGVEAFGAERWNEATNYLATAGLLKTDGFMEAVNGLDNAAQVIVALADDPDAVAEIMSLRPVALAARLGRMSAAIDGEKKPATFSKAPEPIKPVRPGRVATAPDPAKMTTAEYLAYRKRTAPKHLGGQGQAA